VVACGSAHNHNGLFTFIFQSVVYTPAQPARASSRPTLPDRVVARCGHAGACVHWQRSSPTTSAGLLGTSALLEPLHCHVRSTRIVREREKGGQSKPPRQPPPAPSVCAAPSRITSSCTNGRATPCLHSKGMGTTLPTGPCTTRALTATWMPYARLLHKEETRTLQTTFCGHLSIGERDAHAPTTVQHCFCGSLHHLMHTNFALVLTWRMCVWSRVAHTRSATYATSQDCVGNECHDNLHRRHQGQRRWSRHLPLVIE
jgi:hypothetical protein